MTTSGKWKRSFECPNYSLILVKERRACKDKQFYRRRNGLQVTSSNIKVKRPYLKLVESPLDLGIPTLQVTLVAFVGDALFEVALRLKLPQTQLHRFQSAGRKRYGKLRIMTPQSPYVLEECTQLRNGFLINRTLLTRCRRF